MTNTVECPICYEQKRPYYSDNIGCNNYKLICEDCITQLRTNHCPFCRNIHHERIVNNSVTNNSQTNNRQLYLQYIVNSIINLLNNSYNINSINNDDVRNAINNAIQQRVQ